MKDTQKSARNSAPDGKTYKGFSEEERAAMKQHAQEMKAEARRGQRADKEEEEKNDVLAKIAEMVESDRVMAERIHAIITASVPSLSPKLWYGMPAYAKDGNIICFFQPALKFKTRYATLGFSDKAKLDEGTLWPNAYALTELTAAAEAQIIDLVKKAVN